MLISANQKIKYKVMASNDVLKWYLKKSINSLIQSLERRISTNTAIQTETNFHPVQAGGSGPERLRAAQAIYYQHKDVERTIIECNETISKLRLIRLAIDYADVHLLIHLFSHHALHSYEDMLRAVGVEPISPPLSNQEEYVMVA